MYLRLLPVLALLALASGPAFAATDAATVCDMLAGSPDDMDLAGTLESKGISLEEINPQSAAAPCQQALADHPADRRLLFEYGRVLRKEGYAGAAFSLYERAADQGSSIAMVSLGLFYDDGEIVPQDYAKAAAYYGRAADLGSLAGMSDLAWLYRNGHIPGKDASDSAFVFAKAAALGDNWSALDLGNQYEMGLGVKQDLKLAEMLFQQALASPSKGIVITANNALAWLAAEYHQGDLAAAEKFANQALASIPADDADDRASYLDTRALIRHQLGRDQDALADEEEAFKLAPDSAPIADRLGDIYIALGRKADAKTAWQKALTLDAPTGMDEPNFSADGIRKKIAAAA